MLDNMIIRFWSHLWSYKSKKKKKKKKTCLFH